MNIPLLDRLREAAGAFVPLDALGPGREGVSRDLEELIGFGFAIERHPYLGAAYRGPADRLCPDQIEFELGTRRIGRKVAVWSRVASTNDLAAHAAGSASNEGLVILAEEQTAGRGRRGRTWAAPSRSSLLMSTLLFPTGELLDPGWLTSLAAVAVAEVVSDWTGRAAAIKWPNDVRVDGRKIAGILVERGAGAVIGIGLNANLDAAELPDDLRDRATSLSLLAGRRVDRSELARTLIRRLDLRYDESLREGAAALVTPWRDRSEHLGRIVRVSTAEATIGGRVVDLDFREGLTLALDSGRRVLVPISRLVAIATEP